MTRPLDVAALPASPSDRALAIKARSKPDAAKPRLSTKAEERLAEIDERTAVSYSEIEELTYRLHRVAKRISNGHAEHHPDVELEAARVATKH